jgi:hypothetical protein
MLSVHSNTFIIEQFKNNCHRSHSVDAQQNGDNHCADKRKDFSSVNYGSSSIS